MLLELEQISTAQKHSPERRAAARKIWETRRVELESGYQTNRSSQNYQAYFEGLEYFFDYIRSLGTGNLVLDIGAGTTRGISELSESYIGMGLSFFATGLVRSRLVQQHIGNERFRTTPAEVLRGFQEESVSGILALHSIAYCTSAELVVTRIHQVLVAGGVVKCVFPTKEDYVGTISKTTEQNADKFITEWKRLGYDVAVHNTDPSLTIVLTIKPGGVPSVSAKYLLDEDAKRWKDKKFARMESPQSISPMIESIIQSPYSPRLILRNHLTILNNYDNYDKTIGIKPKIFPILNRNFELQKIHNHNTLNNP